MARTFALANEWTGVRGQARMMAMEPVAYEVDGDGKPISCEFDYEVIYKWTSYFVHATVSCLEGHFVEAGETFRVYPRQEFEQGRADDALFNLVAYLHKTFVYAFRALKQEPPDELLAELHELLKSYAK